MVSGVNRKSTGSANMGLDPVTLFQLAPHREVLTPIKFEDCNTFCAQSLCEGVFGRKRCLILETGEFLLFRHQADTEASGKRERKKEWTGGEESYSLREIDGTTTLTTAFDVPPDMEEYFKANYPKALERVTVLAEM